MLLTGKKFKAGLVNYAIASIVLQRQRTVTSEEEAKLKLLLAA
jgi:hypothetical protein